MKLLRLQLQLVLLFVHIADLLLQALALAFESIALLRDLAEFVGLPLSSVSHVLARPITGIEQRVDHLNTLLNVLRVCRPKITHGRHLMKHQSVVD